MKYKQQSVIFVLEQWFFSSENTDETWVNVTKSLNLLFQILYKNKNQEIVPSWWEYQE